MSGAVLCQLATGFFSELKEFGGFPFATDRILFWSVLVGVLVICIGVFRSGAVRALFRRELSAYFLSPIAYVVLTVFVFISSILFFIYIKNRAGDVGGILGTMSFIMIFVSPILTMRLFAEESSSGTIEVLMTAPITDVQVVLAKYFAALFFYAFLFLPTLAYPLVLCWLGEPDEGVVLSGYIGAMLIGAFYLSVGILMSSMSKNQIVAAVAGVILLLLLWIAGFFAPTGTDWAHHALQYVSLIGHLEPMLKGIVDSRDVLFFVSFVAFFLFLTVRSVESRKWRL